MLETLADFYKSTSIVDLIYLVITIWSLISCYKKGFILSILSMAKWLLAYVITLILFPRVKPYVKDIIDNEYLLDVGLGITIFIVVIFLVLLVNKGISKAVRYWYRWTRYNIWILFWLYKSLYNFCLYFFRYSYRL